MSAGACRSGRAERIKAGRPRIAIATSTRFWLLDLARELAAMGHDVRFYSIMPDSRCEYFGLDRKYCSSVLAPMAPLVAWELGLPRLAPRVREQMFNAALNRTIMWRMEPCDLFIGISGAILEAAHHARRKHGAKIFVERGSTHILHQAEILRARGAEAPSDYVIQRELEGYAMADRIFVPATQVSQSFERDPEARAKLVTNPYGVDLDLFPVREGGNEGQPTVLMVGGWTYRKGVDILTEAMEMIPDARLLHVGGKGDAPFPKSDRMIHVDSVDQKDLSKYYHAADVFVLPSREEGLAMVQLQALATGLPIVFSDGTGGRDLAFSEGLAARMDEVPTGDPAALAAAIRGRLDMRHRLPALAEEDRQLLSWRRYARNYVPVIEEVLAEESDR